MGSRLLKVTVRLSVVPDIVGLTMAPVIPLQHLAARHEAVNQADEPVSGEVHGKSNRKLPYRENP